MFAGRQHPLAAFGTRTELELGLFAQPRIVERTGRRELAGHSGLARLVGLVPVVVERRVVHRGHRQLTRGLAVALQRRHVAERCASPAPDRHRNRTDTLAGVGQHAAQRCPRQHQRAAHARRDQHDDRAAGGDEAAQRFADKRTDPSAGPTERVEVGHDLVGTADDVQQPEQRQSQQPPSDRQAETAHALALADERNPDSDERDRHHETAQPGEPADHGLDTATERARQIEVDGQAEQHARGDEPDPGKFVFATFDGLAELGRSLAAS